MSAAGSAALIGDIWLGWFQRPSERRCPSSGTGSSWPANLVQYSAHCLVHRESAKSAIGAGIGFRCQAAADSLIHPDSVCGVGVQVAPPTLRRCVVGAYATGVVRSVVRCLVQTQQRLVQSMVQGDRQVLGTPGAAPVRDRHPCLTIRGISNIVSLEGA